MKKLFYTETPLYDHNNAKENAHLYPDIRFECDGYNVIVEVDEHTSC